jgi:hypothetical protein
MRAALRRPTCEFGLRPATVSGRRAVEPSGLGGARLQAPMSRRTARAEIDMACALACAARAPDNRAPKHRPSRQQPLTLAWRRSNERVGLTIRPAAVPQRPTSDRRGRTDRCSGRSRGGSPRRPLGSGAAAPRLNSSVRPLTDSEAALRVASYQTPLAATRSPDIVYLLAAQVAACEAAGVELLCCPEGVLGGLADHVAPARRVVFPAGGGQLADALAPLASATVTTIVGYTERDAAGRLFNTAAVCHRGAVVGRYRKHHPPLRRHGGRRGVRLHGRGAHVRHPAPPRFDVRRARPRHGRAWCGGVPRSDQ